MKNTKRTLTATTLAICLLMPAAANAASFKDMPASTHWAYQGLRYTTDKGYMSGYEDHTLRIANNITRAEAASMLNRMVGKTATQKANHFKDMNASNWFYKNMMNLYSLGYINGTSNTTISPNKTITREEAFTIIARIAKDKGIERKGALRFKDEEAVAPWAKDSIRYLADTGIIKGANGKVNPKSPISRAEFATVLYQLELAKAGNLNIKPNQPTQKDIETPRKTGLPETNRPKWFNNLEEKRKEELEKKRQQPATPPTREDKKEDKPVTPTPQKPDKSQEERQTQPDNPNPKGYEVAQVRDYTTPVPGPAIPSNRKVETVQHIDGRTYYGVHMDNVDAYVVKEVNRIRVESGLKPLKVLANWDDKTYLRSTEANMAMADYNTSEWYQKDLEAGHPFENRGKFNTKHKRPDGGDIKSLFNRLYVPKELGTMDVNGAAENLQWSYRDDADTAEAFAKEIVDGYMDSPGHRANILGEGYRFINSGTTLQTNSDGSNINDGSRTDVANCLNFG